jgi:2-polyprenyl-6-hydroxyphenyl methylase/3-demethylubiquinone-9 3-methyltransferase
VVGSDLRELDTHFEFGQNWRSFASLVTEEHIVEAKRGLLRLFPDSELKGRSFLDIGCGSGLSMLAAKQLGAGTVEGVDIDPNSVQTTQALLRKHFPEGGWSARVKSVLDLRAEADGLHDIVYSWGVLHHTGAMWTAMERAAALVKPGGHVAVALYRKTPLCGLWRLEKRVYTSAGPAVRTVIRGLYKSACVTALMLTGRNPIRYIRQFKANRGMDWSHDISDWLGGYPYESVLPDQVERFMKERGFSMVRMFERPVGLRAVLGSHCDEFVAVRGK